VNRCGRRAAGEALELDGAAGVEDLKLMLRHSQDSLGGCFAGVTFR
jgi:hypothetical protein